MNPLFWSDCKGRFSFPIRLYLSQPTSLLTFVLSILFPIPWCDVSFVGLSFLAGYTHIFSNSRKCQDVSRTRENSELISLSPFLVMQFMFSLLNWFCLDPWGMFLHPIFPCQSCWGEGVSATAWTSGNWQRQTAIRNNIS